MEPKAIIDAVRTIVIGLDGRLLLPDIENARRLVDAGEPGVALENLCTQLYEYDVPVPREMLLQIAAVGEEMQLAPNLWTDLTVEP